MKPIEKGLVMIVKRDSILQWGYTIKYTRDVSTTSRHHYNHLLNQHKCIMSHIHPVSTRENHQKNVWYYNKELRDHHRYHDIVPITGPILALLSDHLTSKVHPTRCVYHYNQTGFGNQIFLKTFQIFSSVKSLKQPVSDCWSGGFIGAILYS